MLVTSKYALLKATLSFLSEGVETILEELIHLFENNFCNRLNWNLFLSGFVKYFLDTAVDRNSYSVQEINDTI